MLLMPPRHGKSELASRQFPAWHLGHYPDHEIIACSYNVSLAMSFSRKVKMVLDDPKYQTVFNTRLHPDFQANEEWGLDGNRGGYVAAGVGGGITGKGAHVLIIDDPIKNAEEADSADVREKLMDWYGSTAYTRLAPGGGVLVIQTWWHDDDLAGKLQTAMKNDPDADQFEVVKYPAIAEGDEYIELATDQIVVDPDLSDLSVPDQVAMKLSGSCTAYLKLRSKGEALHPERYDTQKLLRIKKTLQPRHWSALYQQNPVPDEGMYFVKEWFRRGAVPHAKRCNIYQTWDFAITEKKQSDYTVGTCGYQDDDDRIHVKDVRRFRSQDSGFIVDTMFQFYLDHSGDNKNVIIGVEDGQIWKALSTLFFKRCKEKNVYPTVVVLVPITDKMARARPLQGRMQQGMVSFDETAEWYDTVRQEMLRFPAGVHDDCVDSLAWLAQLVLGRAAPDKPKPPKTESWQARLGREGRAMGAGHMSA